MPEKKRVNLYLTKANYARLQRVVAQLPGVSVSSLVDEVIEVSLPMLERLAESLRSGDPEALRRSVALAMGEEFVRMMGWTSGGEEVSTE